MFNLKLLVFLLAIFYSTKAYKLLLVFPFPSKSHAILGETMIEHLVKAGHEVTYVTAFAPDHQQSNVTVIDVGDRFKQPNSDEQIKLKDVMDKRENSNSLVSFVTKFTTINKHVLKHPNVQKLLADTRQQFDAVIVEWLYNEATAGFSVVFNCPLIWFSTLEPHWLIMKTIDEVLHPAYTVNLLNFNIPPLTLMQRAKGLCQLILGNLLQKFWLSSLENELYEQYLVPFIRKRRSDVPSLESVKFNGSLILSYSHVSTGTAIRFPPNFISVGGYHLKPTVPPLPETLQNLMDNSEHGVIYFSMGSIIRSKFFPDDIKQELLNIFGKLKQTVIWKFEDDLPNRPNNVHILKWAPQNSILAHANCVLFITHGGLLSTIETINFEVPIIGIPVYLDQFVNVAKSVNRGFAKKVDLSYTIAADLEVAIKEILSNPQYTATIKKVSQIYHDRPVPPSKELVHWVEHVVKTQGALHLRSPALMVPWYQKLYLDLIICLFIALIIFKFILKILKRKILLLRQRKMKSQ